MLFILALALLIFGPKRLPELARDLGKAIRSFQQASQQIAGELTKEMDQATKTLDQAKESVSGALGDVADTTSTELTQAAAVASGELQDAAGAINTELQQAAAAASAPVRSTVAVAEPAATSTPSLPDAPAALEQGEPAGGPNEPEATVVQPATETTAAPSAGGSAYVI